MAQQKKMINRIWLVCIICCYAFLVTSCGGGSDTSGSSSSSPTVTTVAGTGSWGSTDGPGSEATFHALAGIACDGKNLYVAETFQNTIRKVSLSTGVVTTLAGTAGISGANDGVGASARFRYPRGVTTDGTHVYVADLGNSAIRKIVIATGEVTTVAGEAGMRGSDDGTGSQARFSAPEGITTDGSNLYVADNLNGAIRKIEISTAKVSTLAGSNHYGFADGTGSAATFGYMTAITTDGTNVYVTDSGNHNVRKVVTSTGVVTTIAGNAGIGPKLFTAPVGIATDGINLYVSDLGEPTIKKIVLSTGEVTTLVDGIAAMGITKDGSNLYVTSYATIKRIAMF